MSEQPKQEQTWRFDGERFVVTNGEQTLYNIQDAWIVIREMQSSLEEAQRERVRLQRMLEDLTPGGSDFFESPDNCVRFIKERAATTTSIAKERNELRDLNTDLQRRLEAAQAANAGCPCQYGKPCDPRCTCVMPTSSRGCTRCCRYGSLEQRTAKAAALRVAEAKAGLLTPAVKHAMLMRNSAMYNDEVRAEAKEWMARYDAFEAARQEEQ